jgi:hypothetical protein
MRLFLLTLRRHPLRMPLATQLGRLRARQQGLLRGIFTHTPLHRPSAEEHRFQSFVDHLRRLGLASNSVAAHLGKTEHDIQSVGEISV